ncbi:hypothetical protein BDR07DRAFT_1468401 [Suillus spraguei]|nr:hypothetical protein BDR07DRAFT_1468401 [Suillus spraguei]
MSPLSKAWSLVVVLAAAAFVPRGAFAQSSNVICLSSFGWMNNTLRQNPCLVTVYLQSACGTVMSIDPLPLGDVYEGPSAAGANSCECNTVTYSMISACSVCQNGSYLSWSSWSASCSQMSIREYPMPIPAGTRVPNWAYLNVTDSEFSSSAAQSNGDLPESTATIVPSTTTVIHSTTLPASFITVYISSTTSTGPSMTPSSTSLNIRATAGGAVGGIVGAAAIVGLATWFFLKRRRSSTMPSAGFGKLNRGLDHTRSHYSTDNTTFQMTRQSRLYDPSDPTTFLGHPHSPTGLVTSSSNIDVNPSMPSSAFPQQLRSGQYAGIPQI